MKLVKKFIITGCDSRGDGDSPYLTRWIFPRILGLRPLLHKFHRSDADEHHDHPWWFVTIILWRGYYEETVESETMRCEHCEWFRRAAVKHCSWEKCERTYTPITKRKRVWPGMILFRRAEHRHRVVLVDGKPAWTLVFTGRKKRVWGFFTARGWQDFKSYFEERGC